MINNINGFIDEIEIRKNAEPNENIKEAYEGRIEKAKSFLSKSNYSITEISNKCGYKSEFHFMRQFKKETGLTPTEFRRSSSWTQIEKSR